jgi:glycogen debranching enzyme
VLTQSVCFRYQGLDGMGRTSVVAFSERPDVIAAGEASFRMAIDAEQRREIYVEVGDEGTEPPSRTRFRAAAARARFAMRERRRQGARITTNGRLFNAWIDKSRSDLALLTTPMPTGPYPYAGIPWFSTCFGRDGIITAWQILWLEPVLAKGVLSYLASWQAQETSAFRDSEPGKIMHETRRGEMAALGGGALRPLLRRGRHDARCSWPWPAPMPSAPATTPRSTSGGRRWSGPPDGW